VNQPSRRPLRGLRSRVIENPGMGDRIQRNTHLFSEQLAVAFMLNGSSQLLSDLRSQPGSALTKAMGIDTLVAYQGLPCPGTTIATFPEYGGTSVCHLDGAAQAPYWMPSSAVRGALPSGNSFISTNDVTVDLLAALANPRPATVLRRDAGGLVMTVNAPEQGYVWIDRAWWPDWQVVIDGQAVPTYRALGGQLVPIQAGNHTIEQRFVPWDVLIGLALTIGSLAFGCIALWSIRRRRRRAANPTSAPVDQER